MSLDAGLLSCSIQDLIQVSYDVRVKCCSEAGFFKTYFESRYLIFTAGGRMREGSGSESEKMDIVFSSTSLAGAA